MGSTDPAWLVAARQLLGTREAAGIANSATILGWAKLLGLKVLGIVYNADSVPWCGLFVAHCLRAGGVDLSGMKVGVRAKAWAMWGANLAADFLSPGAILVFEREGGGHVAFYVGEDATHYHVIGGNQGDRVSIMRLAKSRCIARRWPRGVPVVGGPVRLGVSSAPVSRNEA
ncbi:TIGR02594 family protein [Sphingobium sp. JS3065]|uniref:TIGR02594 family protein n=1 Tax=Sphingobium sp. JS3065 TaxID=2970925 RepID=UPI002264F5DA|nr:TIGR02594 family protein [Sphingobium sp. JS3065]UZW55568.1 TIGR02594 family protein [Sphingobium sp. JS3065]